MFKRLHFLVVIIPGYARWSCKHGISCRDLAEMMQERGREADPVTIMRWVHRYSPELMKRIRWCQGYRATFWRVNETCVKVGGACTDLFRAVDRCARLIDFILADRRNQTAAHRFLRKALMTTMCHWPPSSITTDQLGSFRKAISRLQQKGVLSDMTKHRSNKTLKNVIEPDHGALKQVIISSRGFQTIKTASAAIKGFEVLRMFRRGYHLPCELHVRDKMCLINKPLEVFVVAG